MYSKEIKQEIKQVSAKINRSRKFTKAFSRILENFDIPEDLLSCNISDIKICIAHDLPVPRCICGKLTSYQKDIEGQFYSVSCSMKCRSVTPRYTKALSDAKIKMYSDPKLKKEVEDKKTKTCLKNNGVLFPMQSPEIHHKHQSNSMQADANGLRGYESIGLEYLTAIYKTVEIGSLYLKKNDIKIQWNDDQGKLRSSFPDFFVDDINCFVEIKSVYTREKGKYKIKKCQERLNDLGFGYVICTIIPNKRIGNKRMYQYLWETFNLEHISET